MNDGIPKRLHEIANRYGIDTLLAVETGSRAYGFPDRHSEHEVGLAYTSARMQDVPMHIDEDADVIPSERLHVTLVKERELEQRLRTSDPRYVDWVCSPIVHVGREDIGRLRDLAKRCLDPVAYARGCVAQAHETMSDPVAMTMPGRCLRAVRTLLAARHALTTNALPPVTLAGLTADIDPGLRTSIDGLVVDKACGLRLEADWSADVTRQLAELIEELKHDIERKNA